MHSGPTAGEVRNFFQKFRQVGAAPTNVQAIVTQYDETRAHGKVHEHIETIVPMNRFDHTPSFRLQKLRTSPKNQSPAVIGRDFVAYLPPRPLGAPSRITLVLDVDETLVHATTTPQPGVRYDHEFLVVVDGRSHSIHVLYRPGLHEFLGFVAERFEVVIFTASVKAYCDQVIDRLDPYGGLGTLRLFRENCTAVGKTHIKDLQFLGRDLEKIAIIDNSPNAYLYQQRNAIPIETWINDPNDRRLLEMLPLLQNLSFSASVYDVLDPYNANGTV